MSDQKTEFSCRFFSTSLSSGFSQSQVLLEKLKDEKQAAQAITMIQEGASLWASTPETYIGILALISQWEDEKSKANILEAIVDKLTPENVNYYFEMGDKRFTIAHFLAEDRGYPELLNQVLAIDGINVNLSAIFYPKLETFLSDPSLKPDALPKPEIEVFKEIEELTISIRDEKISLRTSKHFAYTPISFTHNEKIACALIEAGARFWEGELDSLYMPDSRPCTNEAFLIAMALQLPAQKINKFNVPSSSHTIFYHALTQNLLHIAALLLQKYPDLDKKIKISWFPRVYSHIKMSPMEYAELTNNTFLIKLLTAYGTKRTSDERLETLKEKEKAFADKYAEEAEEFEGAPSLNDSDNESDVLADDKLSWKPTLSYPSYFTPSSTSSTSTSSVSSYSSTDKSTSSPSVIYKP